MRTRIATAVILLALGAGCTPRKPPPPDPLSIAAGPGFEDWYAGTTSMRSELEALIHQIPSTGGEARIQLARRIVAYGEPAVPQLVATLSSPSSDMRGAAAWMLGFLGDPRTTDRLVEVLDDVEPAVRFEAAASLLKMQDARGLETIVSGLESRDAMTRSKCIILLEKLTGETFEYEADQEPDERSAAVARWRAWAEGRTHR